MATPLTYDEIAYYSDPDAPGNIEAALTRLEASFRELRELMEVAEMDDPRDRAAIKGGARDMIQALAQAEQYDNESIRLAATSRGPAA